MPQPPTDGCLANKRTPRTRWGSRPCTPSPCHTHHGVACVIPPSLCTMCHGRKWPLPPLPHTETARGGGEGPWVGPPEPLQLRLPNGGWWGPPVRGTSPRHPPSTCRDPLTPPPCPPPVPHPGWGGAARACCSSPRRPLLHYTDSAGRQESGGAPHCPERPPPPPPTTAGAKGQPAPGGLLCRGDEATGRFVPAPNGGLHPRHQAQTPVGG